MDKIRMESLAFDGAPNYRADHERDMHIIARHMVSIRGGRHFYKMMSLASQGMKASQYNAAFRSKPR